MALYHADSALRYALECLRRPSFTLKPEQIRAIKSVLVGYDTFVWLPTGFDVLRPYHLTRLFHIAHLVVN